MRQNTTLVKNGTSILENFKSFITEQKSESYRVVVISNDSTTAKRIEEEAKKLNYPSYVVPFDGAYTVYNDNTRTIHKNDDDKGFEINPSDTVIFVRGTPDRDSHLDLITQLQRAGYCVVNSRQALETATDKYRSYLKLKDFGLVQPKTVLLPNQDNVERAYNELETQFPIILKTLRGAKGVGVLFVESERSLNSLVQLLFKQDENTDILIQEYIKTEFDVRVLILGGKVIATMRRDVVEGDFRSNASQGAKVTTYDLTELESEQCILAAKAIGGLFAGVDFIPSKNPKTQPPYILEVNSSPGTENIEKANNKNIVKDVLSYFSDTKVRYTIPNECGWEEVVTIKPFGDLTAKFDTGNSGMPVLHAEDIKVNGKKITFTTNNKTITTKLVGTYTTVTGAGQDDRYIAELEFEFAGSNYGEVQFGLDNRDDLSTDVLLNRKLMRLLNVMVNPQRNYLITTPMSLDK